MTKKGERMRKGIPMSNSDATAYAHLTVTTSPSWYGIELSIALAEAS